MFRSIPCLTISRLGNAEGHGFRRGRTHMRREGESLPEHCCAPQDGHTPLHLAADDGNAAVVEQLLAAGADTEAKCEVRRAGDAGCRLG